MADWSDTFTNQELFALEAKIEKIYLEAFQELNLKYKQYLKGWDEVVTEDDGEIKVVHHKGLAERYDEEYKAYQNGAYTDQEFQEWVMAQVGRGERWESLRDDMSKRITQANLNGQDLINGKTPDIFKENYNYSAYTIESAFGSDSKYAGVSFNIMDRKTAQHLMTGQRKLLPKCKVSIPKDHKWNAEKLQGALLQGILQGDDINDISKRFMQVTNMNKTSAVRNARTSFTGAQNAGRIESYNDAEDMGIKLYMEWISTFDERTRESHVQMNGVRVPNGDSFPNGLRWPADPDGSPSEVYNCRCTVRAILPEINDDARTDNTIDSYQEWMARRSILKNIRQEYRRVKAAGGRPQEIELSESERRKILVKGISTKKAIYDNGELGEIAKFVKPAYDSKGNLMYDVTMHGTWKNTFFFGTKIDAYLLAEIIINRPDYKPNMPVRLLSCSTGNTDYSGNCFAQILANQLESVVYAPTDVLYLKQANGRVRIEVGEYNDGELKPFWGRGKL